MSHGPPWEMDMYTEIISPVFRTPQTRDVGALPPPHPTDKGVLYTPCDDASNSPTSEAPPIYATPTKEAATIGASAASAAVNDQPGPGQPPYPTQPPQPAQPTYATPTFADAATIEWEAAAFVKAAASAAGSGHRRDNSGDGRDGDDADAGAGDRCHNNTAADTANTTDDDDEDDDDDDNDFGELEDLLADDDDFDLSEYLSEFLELTDTISVASLAMTTLAMSVNSDYAAAADTETCDYAEVDGFFNDPPANGTAPSSAASSSAAPEADTGGTGRSHEAAQAVVSVTRDPGVMGKIADGAGASAEPVVKRRASAQSGDPKISVPFNVNISWRRQSRMAIPSYDSNPDFTDDTASGYEEADDLQLQASLKNRIATLCGHDMVSRLCTKLVLEGDLNKIIRITRVRKKAIAKERRYILLDSTLLWAAYADRPGQKLVLKGRLDIGEYSIFDLPDGMAQGKISVNNAFAVNSLAKNKVNVVIAHDAHEKLTWLEAFRKLGVKVEMCQTPDNLGLR